MDTSLSAQIERLVLDNNFSGVIAVEIESVTEYQQAFGFADRANRRANRLDTRFGIASGTKGFTAVAIGQLIEAGKIDLETPLHACVGVALPNVDREVTIKHLLSHTSGVADYFDEELVDDASDFFLEIPWYQLISPSDYIPTFVDEEMKFNPGTRFSYSNGGFILLGAVIETVSGRPFQRYVEEEIFVPSGMTASGFFPMNELPGNTAFGYVEAEGLKTNIFNLPIVGASDGGAFTTAADMRHFWTALLNHKLIGKDLLRQFHQPQSAVNDDGTSYGLGFWLGNKGVHLEGYDAGVSFKSLWCAEKDTLITLLANTAAGVWPLAGLLETELL